MTGGSVRSLGPGLINSKTNSRGLSGKDYTITPTKGRSSHPLHLSVFRGSGTRSEENIPLVTQSETAFNGNDTTTENLPHTGRLRTSSLTSDASSQRSKGVDSGNSSLIDSSSTDSYLDFGGGRSRTTSTSKSDQHLNHIEQHGYIVGHTRVKHPSSNGSVACGSDKVSLNASDMTETAEDSWPSALNEEEEISLPWTFENEPDQCIAASHPFLNTSQAYTVIGDDSNNTHEFINECNNHRRVTEGNIFYLDQCQTVDTMDMPVLNICPGQSSDHFPKTKHSDPNQENIPLLNNGETVQCLESLDRLLQPQRVRSPLRRSSSLSNISSTSSTINKTSSTQLVRSKPHVLSPTSQQGSTQCSHSQAGNSTSSFHDRRKDISTNSHTPISVEQPFHTDSINSTEVVFRKNEAASIPEHVLFRGPFIPPSNSNIPMETLSNATIANSPLTNQVETKPDTCLPSDSSSKSLTGMDNFCPHEKPPHTSTQKFQISESNGSAFDEVTDQYQTGQSPPGSGSSITPIPTHSSKLSVRNLKSVLGQGAPFSWSMKEQEKSTSPPHTKPLQVLVPRINKPGDEKKQESFGSSQEVPLSLPNQDSDLSGCERTQDVHQTRSIVPSQVVHHRPIHGPQPNGIPGITSPDPVQIYPQPYQTPIPQVAPAPFQPYFFNFQNPWIPCAFVPADQNHGRQYPVCPENIPPSFVPVQGMHINPTGADQNVAIMQGPNNQFFMANKSDLAFYASLSNGTSCSGPTPHRNMATSEWLAPGELTHQKLHGMNDSLPENRKTSHCNGQPLNNVRLLSQECQRYSWPAPATIDTVRATKSENQENQLNAEQVEQQKQQHPVSSVPPTRPLSVTVDFDPKPSQLPNQTVVHMDKGRNCSILGRLRKRYQQSDKTATTQLDGDDCQQPLNGGFSLHGEDVDNNEYQAGMVFNIEKSCFESGFLGSRDNLHASPGSRGQSTTPSSVDGAAGDNNRDSLRDSNTSQLGLIKGGQRASGYRTFLNRETPDYKILCLVAAVFNPLFGLIAFFCNHRARQNYRQHRLAKANNLYFFTIVLSTGGMFITLISIALLVARIAVLNPGKSGTSVVDPTLSCSNRLFGHDDFLMTFFDMDMKLYCQVIKKEKVINALRHYLLLDAQTKRKYTDTQTGIGGNSTNSADGKGGSLEDLSGNLTNSDTSKETDTKPVGNPSAKDGNLSPIDSNGNSNNKDDKAGEKTSEDTKGGKKPQQGKDKKAPAGRSNARTGMTVSGSDEPYIAPGLEMEYQKFLNGQRRSKATPEEQKLLMEKNSILSPNKNPPNTSVVNTDSSNNTLPTTTEASVGTSNAVV